MNIISASSLGCKEFKQRHGIKYAYITGGMYHGIASKELVTAMANSNFMGYFGAGGLSLNKIEEAIQYFQNNIAGSNYGINILYNHIVSAKESSIIELLLKYEVRSIEAASFANVTPEIVKYRLKGISRTSNGSIQTANNLLAKVSRIGIAKQFMSPPPQYIIEQLLDNRDITDTEAQLAPYIPVANEVCVEAESAGHTDRRASNIVFPSIRSLRDKLSKYYQYDEKICIGTAGGIGTPSAIAAAFIMGADFILTGSINQCTLESGAHLLVKELLGKMGPEDTDFTPTGDMLESDAKIQVLRKGMLFPARAKKLHEIYHKYNSLDELSKEEQKNIRNKIFKGKSFDEIFDEAKQYFSEKLIQEAENNPKAKMGLIFKVYFYRSIKNAYTGIKSEKTDFQIHTGSALGAFNEYVAGTELENMSNRSTPIIGTKLMEEAAKILNSFYHKYIKQINKTFFQ